MFVSKIPIGVMMNNLKILSCHNQGIVVVLIVDHQTSEKYDFKLLVPGNFCTFLHCLSLRPQGPQR